MTAAAVATPLLSAQGVTVRIGNRDIVRDVAIEVRVGEVVGLVGPNGAGKSTLLRALAGVRHTSGDVRLLGTPLYEVDRRERARLVAVVEQLPEAPPTMTVGELVALGRYPHLGLLRRPSAHDHEVVTEAMRRAGCDALAERPLGTLSGGERRRAFIARALAQEARLLLLDEPSANLDAEAQATLFELLRVLASDGAGILVVVHDLTSAAASCDRVVLLHEGRVLASGAPREVVTAEHVLAAYGPHVTVLAHPASGVPIVIPTAATR
ncbi:MAG: ABC transporter ATP-binding protein [Chloroflexi bacterium]|nr:MAG: ABC transporter ATP-binding protein [Chloroflexota bacterium]